MGNACVVGGATPHRCDIVVTNNTDFPLQLDLNQSCGLECDHKGFQVTCGKIVEGAEPPLEIDAHSIGRFSVSGREGTAVAPAGKVFYRNESLNLNVVITWANAGWTTRENASFDAIISGKPESAGGRFSSEPKPWNDVLIGEGDYGTWTMNIKPKKMGDDWKKTISEFKNFRLI